MKGRWHKRGLTTWWDIAVDLSPRATPSAGARRAVRALDLANVRGACCGWHGAPSVEPGDVTRTGGGGDHLSGVRLQERATRRSPDMRAARPGCRRAFARLTAASERQWEGVPLADGRVRTGMRGRSPDRPSRSGSPRRPRPRPGIGSARPRGGGGHLCAAPMYVTTAHVWSRRMSDERGKRLQMIRRERSVAPLRPRAFLVSSSSGAVRGLSTATTARWSTSPTPALRRRSLRTTWASGCEARMCAMGGRTG